MVGLNLPVAGGLFAGEPRVRLPDAVGVGANTAAVAVDADSVQEQSFADGTVPGLGGDLDGLPVVVLRGVSDGYVDVVAQPFHEVVADDAEDYGAHRRDGYVVPVEVVEEAHGDAVGGWFVNQ